MEHDSPEELSRSARPHLVAGLFLLLAGLAATAGTLALARQSGGSYWIAWGAIGGGGLSILRGISRKVRSSTSRRVKASWIAGGLIALAVPLIVAGIMLASIAGPPSASQVNIVEASSVRSASGDIVVSGRVENRDTRWSMQGTRVAIHVLDDNVKELFSFDVEVNPSKVPPNGSATYSGSHIAPAAATRVKTAARWHWVKD